MNFRDEDIDSFEVLDIEFITKSGGESILDRGNGVRESTWIFDTQT